MRTIKFRAWDTGAEQMYSWESIKHHLNEHLEHHMVEVMQFTGLHDRNGKEIFESDIAKEGNKIFKVNYYLAFFILDKVKKIQFQSNNSIPLSDYYDQIEVIGNIYENPELLEGDTQ